MEVIGRCGGDEKTERPRRTDKSQTLKKLFQISYRILYLKEQLQHTIIVIVYGDHNVHAYLSET